jgi:hypothetical protein
MRIRFYQTANAARFTLTQMTANEHEKGEINWRRKLKWLLFPLKVVPQIIINIPVQVVEVALDLWELAHET